MTEDLIAMAKLAGYDLEKDQTCREVSTAEIFSTFYRLVDAQAVARTREECASLCMARANDLAKAMLMNPNHLGRPAGSFDHGCMLEAEILAAAIRALGERT